MRIRGKKGRSKPTVGADRAEHPVDLFPFLSIFVCLLGVLSFLDLLLTIMGGTNVQLASAASAQGYKFAYRVLCYENGTVLVPPPGRTLDALLSKAAELDLQAAELRAIQAKRDAVREQLSRQQSDLAGSAVAPTETDFVGLVQEITMVSEISRRSGTMYEEFLLFGIYPGGGIHYYNFLTALNGTPHASLRVGIEALDMSLQVSLEEESGQGY